jgi:hypothetical protein
MCTIGEEDRSSVRANLSKHTGYTGISVLHRLHKLYEFDVIRDTVFDMMHNLPLNVVRKHVKRVMDEGIVDRNVLESKLSLMPWTAGYILELILHACIYIYMAHLLGSTCGRCLECCLTLLIEVQI